MSIFPNRRTPIPTLRESFASPEDIGPPPQLDILPVAQIEDAWCYAACGEMVINFCIGPGSVNKCEIVSFIKTADCCNTNDDVCNRRGCEKDDIEFIFNNWQVTFTGSNQDPIATISLDDLVSEVLFNNNPVEVAIDWTMFSGSHALVVCGVFGDMVYLLDPLLTNSGWRDYNYLLGGEGEWNWDRTWVAMKGGVR